MFKESDFNRQVDKSFASIDKQIQFATSMALNKTATQIKTSLDIQLKRDIDRPTKFTQNAFKIKWSSKRNLESSVEIKPIQAKYLKYAIRGGTRKDETVVIPRKSQQNKFGNLARNKLKRLKAQDKSFIQDNIIFQKLKKSVRPVAYLPQGQTATYKKRFDFYGRAKSTAKGRLNKNMSRAMKNAIATAK